MAPSTKAVEAARQRKVASAERRQARDEWYIDEVMNTVKFSLKQRVRIATEWVRNKTVLNISRPVTKVVTVFWHTYWEAGKQKRRRSEHVVVSDRSKPGEYPKADTTQLMKTIFSELRDEGFESFAGFVGTPIDYGVILELKLNREFLTRTLNEERPKIMQILSRPIT